MKKKGKKSGKIFKNQLITKQLFIGIILGIAIAASLFGSYELIMSVRKKPVFIPPYYDPKVFHKPAGLIKPTIASNSAGLQEEVKMQIPIVMYHYVEYVKDLADIIRQRLDINPYLFAKQIGTLHDEGYHTYFVKDVPDVLSGKIFFAQKSVILTFDDGYEDFYFDVFPVLKKYQMKATIYVIYNYIGRKGFLNEAEIKELLASGLVELGSHTLDHVYLKQMPRTEAETQIIDSKKLLEEKFGVSIESFAYPYGAFSQESIDLVKKSGYKVAVSVIPGINQSMENLYYLSRIRAGYLDGTPNMVKVLKSFTH